jgi:hypothetical protein
VGAHDADRFAGLDKEGLVVLKVVERAHDRVVRFPGTGCATGAAVDDEVLGTLSHLGVEVVHEHALGGFGLPRLRGDLGSAVGADDAGRVVLSERRLGGHGILLVAVSDEADVWLPLRRRAEVCAPLRCRL